jgi:uncharacterized protein DUF6999
MSEPIMPGTGGLPLWQVMAADPAIPMDPGTLRLVISDQRRASRALLYPWIRVASRLAVALIVTGKRLCPVRFAAHDTMDRLCLWFLRRFVSPDAVSLLIRHFIVETNLLNFCAANARLPASAAVGLRPLTLTALASLTGDDAFFRWRSALPPVRVDSHIDVPAAVYEHALICEFALARLCALRDLAPRSPVASPGLSEMTW